MTEIVALVDSGAQRNVFPVSLADRLVVLPACRNLTFRVEQPKRTTGLDSENQATDSVLLPE